MTFQCNNVFGWSAPKNMDRNCRSAMNFNLNLWLLTGNASLRVHREWLNPAALKIISSILKSILNTAGSQ